MISARNSKYLFTYT